MTSTGKADGQRDLDQAYEGLERELPDRMVRAIRWLRDPSSRWIRLPLGLLFIIGGLLWFLPVLGIELLPIGLLLIAEDRVLAEIIRSPHDFGGA